MRYTMNRGDKMKEEERDCLFCVCREAKKGRVAGTILYSHGEIKIVFMRVLLQPQTRGGEIRSLFPPLISHNNGK